MRTLARPLLTAFAFACVALAGGCSLLEAYFLGDVATMAKHAYVSAAQEALPARPYAYVVNVELTACEQSQDMYGNTIGCDFVFPDGTRIRSSFAFYRLGGNAVVHRHAPLVLQVPAGASGFRGTFDDGAGASGSLLVTSGLSSLPTDTSSTLQAEPDTELVILDFPTPPPVPSRMQLRLNYRASSPAIKVMATAKFEVGARTFYPPLLPCVASLAGVAPLMANAIPTGQAVATIAQPCNGKMYDFLGSGDPGPHPMTVVEYYNAALDHYFITGLPGEIAMLDAGASIGGWVRTGLTFNVFRQPGNGTSSVCRYYLPPAFGDSHFFGRGLEECRTTGDRNPGFVLEQPEIMHVWLPTLGSCPPNTKPIYRVFSNRPDANHRYTTQRAVRDEMVARGWLAEGDGPDQVVMCGPA